MRSLSVLHLDTSLGFQVARWCSESPNLETLYLTATSKKREVFTQVDVQFATGDEHTVLPKLRRLVVGDPGPLTKLFIFRHLACPGLLFLDLNFFKVEIVEFYLHFADFY